MSQSEFHHASPQPLVCSLDGGPSIFSLQSSPLFVGGQSFQIVNCAPPKQGLCGTIVWISQPNDAKGKPQTDRGNPNPALKNRPIIGLPLFEGWREDGRNKWKGSVYNPEEAHTYNNLDITLAGDRLTLKGCVAIFCDSETWNRYRGP